MAPVPPEPSPPAPSVVRDQPPQETITTTEQATEPVVSSGQPKVKVSVSGQVNRAINVAGDGDSTEATVTLTKAEFIKQGDKIWVDQTIFPVKAAGGEVSNVLFVGEDVTAQRDARGLEGMHVQAAMAHA